jgi:serine/threonine protein kinase
LLVEHGFFLPGAVAELSELLQPRAPNAIELLRPLQPISSSSSSTVTLVRHRVSEQLYALKVHSKGLVVQLRQHTHVLQELHAMRALDHPFLVTLKGAYQDRTRLYLVYDLCPGGELYTVLAKFGRLPVEMARFYAASIALALGYIHSQEYVYRDLKPENCLLDAQGFVKLCDFGFAKRVVDRTWTMCGTPECTPRRGVRGEGKAREAGVWSLGCNGAHEATRARGVAQGWAHPHTLLIAAAPARAVPSACAQTCRRR